MKSIKFRGKAYQVDSEGILIDSEQWDEIFAEEMAIGARISEDLTEEHWDVINYK